VPYNPRIVVHVSEPPAAVAGAPAPEPGPPEPGRQGPRHRHGSRGGASPDRRRDRWLTVVAFAVVVVPFVYALIRLLAAPTAHLYLPDDLALTDLHVRRALDWNQQLGVFDRNGWNHPGPAYFYVMSLVYRVLGSSFRSLFVGATLLNGLAAVACVAVVRRRTTPARALWAGIWVGVLAVGLAASGTASTTYSETVLGALVSPWNPLVVLFPLLLLLLLCAGSVDRSGASLVGAIAVGTYVVQTDVSTFPLAAAAVAVAGVVWLVTRVRDHRDGAERTDEPATSRWRARALVVGGLFATVLMWLPPVIQQETNTPGNLGLLYRFFTSGQAGQPLGVAVQAAISGLVVVPFGPGGIMNTVVGGTPRGGMVAHLLALATVVAAAGVLVAGVRQRRRFAFGAGLVTLVGCVATVVAVTHVVGVLYGYLVVWVSVLPVAVLIGVGTVRLPARVSREGTVRNLRIGLCGLAVVVAFVACFRVAEIPPLARAGDPSVGRIVELAAPHLDPGQQVAVGDGGAGTGLAGLINFERFIGVVNLLDRDGYHPTIRKNWSVEFGPGYVDDSPQPRTIGLTSWTPSSSSLPGYVGRAGDIAVTVTDRDGHGVPARATG